MTAVPSPSRRPRIAPLVAGAALVAVALGAQLHGVVAGPGPDAYLDDPLLAPPPAETVDRATSGGSNASGYDAAAELERVRSDVDFWAARVKADPRDIVAAVQLAGSDVALARMTGDVASYVAAESAVGIALTAQPDYAPAQAMRATILVSLHRFPEARDLALGVLAVAPDDPTALGALGDSRLELGDLEGARRAYTALVATADGSAAQIRMARLAFVTGDPKAAVAAGRAAVADAVDEGLEGDALAFDHSTLADLLVSTGDTAEARAALAAGLDARPDHPASLVVLARLDAFDGDLDTAIDELDRAIAAIPQPDWLARRSDLLERRAGPGDAAAAAGDRATIDAIARLAGSAGNVYDRVRSLYLSDHGLQPELAVKLAQGELAIRPDIYGYDADAWALVNAGRPVDALVPMRQALAAGTADARLWYHAGIIEAANGLTDAARTHLTEALVLGPALDPVARDRASAALAALP
jgi:tetratricopeptide (TPR) repeat protein